MRKFIILIGIIIISSKIYVLQAQNTFTDIRDRQNYKTVNIGKQIWMAENLNFKAEKESWAYNNEIFNAGIYGQLYTWEMANNVCPDGWHLPSNDEWSELLIYIDNGAGKYDDANFLVANKMKKKGIYYWNLPEKKLVNNPNVTNESGFTALPGGLRDPYGNFYWLGGFAYFWSSTKESDQPFSDHYHFMFDIHDEVVKRIKSANPTAYSVRCIKNKKDEE